MNILLFLLSLALPAAAGYTLFFGEDSMSLPERLIFSFTVGSALLSFYLFALLAGSIPVTVLSVAPFFVPFLIFGFLRRKGIKESVRAWSGPSLSELSFWHKVLFSLFLSLIIWKFCYVIFMVWSAPTVFWDAYTLWNLKAKAIYFGNGALQSAKEGLFDGPYSHYPLNLPIMRAWIALFMGQWDDSFANLHSVVLYLCLLGLVFSFLSKKTGKLRAIIFTYIISAIPVMTYNVLGGYADMAVGYYFLAANIMLYYWYKTGKSRCLIFLGLLSSIAMFTKNEGIAIVFPSLGIAFFTALLQTRLSWKNTATAGALFLASTALIFLWLKESQALQTILRISGVLDSSIAFHPEGLSPLMYYLFVSRSHNIFWTGVVIVLALKGKRVFRIDERLFFIPAVLSFCAVLFVFLFTPNVTWLINGTTINRTLLIVIPVLTLSLGLLFAPDATEKMWAREET